VVEKHDETDAQQDIKDEGGDLLPEESDEEKGGPDEQGVEQVILHLGQHSSSLLRL
jgi:hypothetical protein